ncbi:MAG: alkaline phosphatase family protein [Acidimicrobiales bacterium]
MVPPAPTLPDYGGACIASVVPALLGRSRTPPPSWLPAVAATASQVVLLVLDGLGWIQLDQRRELAPTLAAMQGGPITSVAPTTTATALTSLTTGLPPAVHGVVGYRVKVGPGSVMNVLRWRTAGGDARRAVPPGAFQPHPVFAGTSPPVVTRTEFASTGFSGAHLAGAALHGWRLASAMAVEVRRQLEAGERFVYAYYDGIDKVAHDKGFGDHYEAELVATDRLVADLRDALPAGAALVVTSDHGQVQVDQAAIPVAAELMDRVELLSGEGRFRWLHAGPGAADDLVATARALYGAVAWVHTRAELIERGWFGGVPAAEVEQRLGDVALIPFEPVAFDDPADTGDVRLVCRHGSLTPEECLVPLLATTGSGGGG